MYNRLFNFTQLKSDFERNIVLGNDEIEYNICGFNKKSCNKTEGVSACLKRKNNNIVQEYILGYNSTLSLENGRLELSYTGEKCGDKYYSFVVIFECQFRGTPSIFPTVSRNIIL